MLINTLADLATVVENNPFVGRAGRIRGGWKLQPIKRRCCGISFWTDVKSVVLTGYCGGWNGECEGHSLSFPFTAKQFWAAYVAADQDGVDAWNNSHGCEKCWNEENTPCTDFGLRECGDWPINPECKKCEGHGEILLRDFLFRLNESEEDYETSQTYKG